MTKKKSEIPRRKAIDINLLDWIETQIAIHRFATVTHAIEYSLQEQKNQEVKK